MGSGFLSAGAIRSHIAGGGSAEDIRPFVPEQTYSAITESRLTFADEWVTLLRYAAVSSPAKLIEDCPSGGEGLANLLKKAAAVNNTWDGIVKGVKSRRYTYTRISRLCMQLILGITRSEYTMTAPAYIRVLGFNKRGRELLSEVRDRGCGLPVITNINKESEVLDPGAAKMLALDIRAADIYNIVTGRDPSVWSDHVMKPVIRQG